MALGTERSGRGEMENGVGLDVEWKKKKGMRLTPRCVAQTTRPIDGNAVRGDEEKLAKGIIIIKIKSHPSHEKVSGR